MMLSFVRHRPEGVGELEPQNIIACGIVGDRSVQVAVMHFDTKSGALCPIRSRYAQIDTLREHTPSLGQVCTALTECLEGMHAGAPLEYGQFFLCLPSWCCTSLEATHEMAIEHDTQIRWLRNAKVAPYHVMRLEELLCKSVTEPNYVVADLIPHHFVLDSGRKVGDPVGTTTRVLRLDAHVVLAELGIARGVLRRLNELGISVDAVLSPWTAAGNLLSREEKQRGALVVDVDRRHICCGFYNGATIGHAARLSGGSDDVLDAIATHLRVPPRSLADCVDDWKDAFLPVAADERTQHLPLFHWAATHPGLRELDSAALSAVARLADALHQCVAETQREKGLEVQTLVLVGDDVLTLRALQSTMTDRTGIRCRWDIPSRLHTTNKTEKLRYARAAGLIREGMARPAHRRVLGVGTGKAFPDLVQHQLHAKARQAFWWAVKRYTERAAQRKNAEEQPAVEHEKSKQESPRDALRKKTDSAGQRPPRKPKTGPGSISSLLF